MPHHPRPRSRTLVNTVALALVATPLAVLATAAPAHAAATDIQVLATNDFHGRLLANGKEAGAAVLAGAIDELETEHPNTVFAAAGDLIGASTFESFVADDEPTIDALNEAGLDVSAAGNHEFDKGYADLVGRVQDRAAWEYIAANITEPEGADDLAESWTQTFGDVEVGFVGAVTEDLPSLVSPAGIAGVTVTDIVEATNTEAAALEAAGADVIVLLVHEGAPDTTLASATTETNSFSEIVNGVSPDVDAIVSGHTHLAYNHAVPVPEWVTEGRDVTTRPVVSAGQYGTNLNQLVFSVETTGEESAVTALTQEILPLVTEVPNQDPEEDPTYEPNYTADTAVEDIVADAVAEAEVLGAAPLGEIGGPFNRARRADGTTENRGAESTLGNLVAEVQQWATTDPALGGAEIAFMNPGGLRADMTGTGDGAYPRTLTYKQAAVVQPFANTLVNMTMTGAQIKSALEQQWQPEGASRPFLRLGTSDGFVYNYDPTAPAGQRILDMWLAGEPITATDTYSVTVNSFLASGGDNFGAFSEPTDQRDTGQIDLAAMVDYMEEFGSEGAVEPSYVQHAIGLVWSDNAPETYAPGEAVRFGLTSLAMSTPADVKDDEVSVSLGETELGTFPVVNTIGTEPVDEYGAALVEVVLPAGTPLGTTSLSVAGDNTGTETMVPITVAEAGPEPEPTKVESTLKAKKAPKKITTKKRPKIKIRVTTEDGPASGKVTVFASGEKYTATLKPNGKVNIRIDRYNRRGKKSVRVKYFGNATTKQDTVRLNFRVR